MASKAQLKKIHALKGELSIEDGDYRALLGSYKSENGKPITSSNELSVDQASSLIEHLDNVVEKTPEVRKRVYASPRQQRFIEALWSKVSRASDPQGRHKTLDAFLRRRFHVRRSDHLPRRVAPGIIQALRAMADRKSGTSPSE